MLYYSLSYTKTYTLSYFLLVLLLRFIQLFTLFLSLTRSLLIFYISCLFLVPSFFMCVFFFVVVIVQFDRWLVSVIVWAVLFPFTIIIFFNFCCSPILNKFSFFFFIQVLFKAFVFFREYILLGLCVKFHFYYRNYYKFPLFIIYIMEISLPSKS